jgi:hypothetical protein
MSCLFQSSDDRPTFESLKYRLEDFFSSEAANYTEPQKLMEAAKLQEKEEAEGKGKK